MKQAEKRQLGTEDSGEGKETLAAKSSPLLPRTYIGPMPPPLISNLPCGCSHPANELARDEQDFLIATVPGSDAWFTEVE